MSKLERVARAIFRQCQRHGIEEMHAFTPWGSASKETREMYLLVAKSAMAAARRVKK